MMLFLAMHTDRPTRLDRMKEEKDMHGDKQTTWGEKEDEDGDWMAEKKKM